MRLAVLDDYQRVARRFADWSPVEQRIDMTVFTDALDDADALVARLAPFEIVCLMRERTRLTAEVIARLPRLALIVTTGPHNAAIDVAAAHASGIVVCGTRSVASGTPELTWLLILALARHLPDELASVRRGGWQTTVGMDLNGRTLGIVGLGRIGTRVATVASAFGMSTIAWSPNLTSERARAGGATLVDKETLFRTADFVAICLQLEPSTRGIIAAADLAAMKPTACLVNTARGPLVDEAALIDALTRRRIAGSGIDTFAVEPLPADHPFRCLDNVIATPHLGYVTEATYRTFFTETVEAVLGWLDGRPVRVIREGTPVLPQSG